jgi:hypothetical protein
MGLRLHPARQGVPESWARDHGINMYLGLTLSCSYALASAPMDLHVETLGAIASRRSFSSR